MRNHKFMLKVEVFLILIGAICIVVLFLNELNVKEDVNNLSNILNLTQDKNNNSKYQEIMNKGYCGDGICNRENNENEELCCEDCGCKEGFTCVHSFCIIYNYSQNYSFYQDNTFNFSIEIPQDWSILKHENGVAFRGNKNTSAWFNIVSINVLPILINQTIHEKGIEIAKKREINEISYENTTLGGIVAEKIVSVHPYRNNTLKQINIITRKEDYFYSLSYTSLTEYFNVSIYEFNYTLHTFKFVDNR